MEDDEKEDDLNDIPLFEDTSEVIAELSNQNESSLAPTESASSPLKVFLVKRSKGQPVL